MKVVINKCYGGFSISLEAARFMAERGNAVAKAKVDEYDAKREWYPYDCSSKREAKTKTW